MTFVKGQSGNPAGRKKGHYTNPAKIALSKVIEENSTRIGEMLEEVYKTKGAEAFLNQLEKLYEYHIPKVSRTEIQHLDGDGENTDPPKLVVQFVTSDKKE